MLSKVFVNIKTVLQNHYTVSVLTKLFLLSIYAFSELMNYYWNVSLARLVHQIIYDYHQYGTGPDETWSVQAIFSQYM